jgi:hypothetical protein
MQVRPYGDSDDTLFSAIWRFDPSIYYWSYLALNPIPFV